MSCWMWCWPRPAPLQLRLSKPFHAVHVHYLQPYADINKRTSRLAANEPLFCVNLCQLTFVDVPPQPYAQAMLGMRGVAVRFVHMGL